MLFTTDEVAEYVDETDVKFIRLAFSDVFGTQKNIAIMPGELGRAFSDGIASDHGEVITDALLYLMRACRRQDAG